MTSRSVVFATLLGGAGAETVTKLMGTAAVNFARFPPEQWQKLLDDRSKIPAAVEELLRYEGPVQYNVRYTLRDTEVPSGKIPAGKPVFLLLASANRDSAAFTDADTFDIDRDRTEARTWVWATASTAASAPPWPAWRARSPWRSCSTSCRVMRFSGTACGGYRCRMWPAFSHVPVKVLR